MESKEEKIKLLNSIISHNMTDVLQRLTNYVTKGTDIKRLTEDLLLILKDIVIFNSSANKDYLEALNEEEATELSRNIPSDLAIQMIDILMNTIKDYKNVTSINPIFEITLIKLTSLISEPGIPKFIMVDTCVHDGWLVLNGYDDNLRYYLYFLIVKIRKELIKCFYITYFNT